MGSNSERVENDVRPVNERGQSPAASIPMVILASNKATKQTAETIVSRNEYTTVNNLSRTLASTPIQAGPNNTSVDTADHLAAPVASEIKAILTAAPAIKESAATESVAVRLAASAPVQTSSVKLLDDNLQWQDGLLEFLVDQPDFLVVGILGKRGVGKSTIMSQLAGSKAEVFKAGHRDARDMTQHKTSGIQAYVTHERTILLDVQVKICAYFGN